MQSFDKILIESRNQCLKLEQLAVDDLKNNIDSYLQPSWSSRKLLDGYANFVKSGNTDEESYLTMRQAYSETHGMSNKVFCDVLATHIDKTPNDIENSMFAADGVELENQIKSALYRLRHNGYAPLPFKVPDAIYKSLKKKVLNRMIENHSKQEVDASIAGAKGAATQLRVPSKWASTYEEMYQISGDPAILEIVQRYMGVPPIFNTPVAFLSSHAKPKNTREVSLNAQEYHHDMHRLGFVKLFIYLTDVDEDTGPHTLLSGTHRERPVNLWKDGRHSDKSIKESGIAEQEVNITGKAGTVFLVDTSALHKGASPKGGHRVMAQVQYVNSLFGKPIAMSDHKVELAQTKNDDDINASADLARKYAGIAGVRFMQNYI